LVCIGATRAIFSVGDAEIAENKIYGISLKLL
jgi:hypothetical protein